jgi:arginase family enzyme
VCLSPDLDFGDSAAEARSTDCKIVWVGVNGYVDVQAYRRSHRYGELLFTADDVRRVGIEAIARQALDVAAANGSSIYASIDMAVVDPSFAPGTSKTNWGGISHLDLLRAVTILCGARVVGGDLVGVVPSIDPASLTAGLATIAALHVIRSTPTLGREAFL